MVSNLFLIKFLFIRDIILYKDIKLTIKILFYFFLNIKILGFFFFKKKK